MRLSVDKNDPGFNDVDSRWARILFNNVPRQYVVTASEEEGFILAYQLDARGHPLLGTSGQATLETLRGKVRIELNAEHKIYTTEENPMNIDYRARRLEIVNTPLSSAKDRVTEALNEIEYLIMATPSGARRNTLIDVNVHLVEAQRYLNTLPSEV